MKPIYLKFLAFVVAALMLLSVVSCTTVSGSLDGADTTVGNEETTAEETTTESPDGETTETADLTTETVDETALSVPDDLKLNDEISILYWSDSKYTEFEIEELRADTIGDSIYWRDKQTADLLSVTFRWTPTPGNADNMEAFSSVVEASYEAGDRAYDIVASYSKTMGLLSVKGFLADMNAIENNYLDFSKVWWPSHLVEDVSMGGAMYFLTGDVTTSAIYEMIGLHYNDALRAELQLEDPRELIRAENWTLSKFMEISAGGYVDTDLDGAKSTGDTYGFWAQYSYFGQFYTGSALSTLEDDADDILTISSDFSSPKTYQLVLQLQEFLRNDAVMKTSTTGSGDAFAQERAIFANQRLRCMYYNRAWSEELSHSLFFLPTPKYNSEQESYYTAVGHSVSLFGIMADASPEEQANCTAVLETLAYFSYQSTIPELERIRMCKCYEGEIYARTYGEFLGICRRSITLDHSRIFAPFLENTNGMTQLFSASVYNETSWDDAVEIANTTIKAKLEAIRQTYRDLKQ